MRPFIGHSPGNVLARAFFRLFLHQKIAEKPGSCEEHDIKSGEESDPSAVERGWIGEERRSRFNGGDEKRRKDRQQQEREKEFAHPCLGGNGRKNCAGDDKARSTKEEHED